MKNIFLLLGAVALLTTGCIFPGHRGGGGEYHERGEYHGHERYVEHGTYVEPSVNVRIHAD
jgi:hypothetical protein